MLLGHFHYAHLVPTVEVGQNVLAGEQIGQTLAGWWHMHLEEHAWWRGQHVVLNPSARAASWRCFQQRRARHSVDANLREVRRERGYAHAGLTDREESSFRSRSRPISSR